MKQFNISYVVLPIKSVGVQGDQRTYKHPLLLYTSLETIKDLGWGKFNEISTFITNCSSHLNRVLLMISNDHFDS